MNNDIQTPIRAIHQDQLTEFPNVIEDFKAVIVLAEGIFFNNSPWESNLSVRRIAQFCHSQLGDIAPRYLAIENGLDFAARYLDEDQSRESTIRDALSKEEVAWNIQTSPELKAGTRQTIEQLDSLGVPVHIISTCSAYMLQTIIDLRVPSLDKLILHGRTGVVSEYDTLKSQRDAVLAQYKHQNVLVMVSANYSQNLAAMPETSATLAFALIGNGKPHQPDHILDMVDVAQSFPLDSAESKSMSKAANQRDRLRQLIAQPTLTDEEMSEVAFLSGPHKIIGNSEMFGYVDPTIGTENVRYLWRDRKLALENSNVRDLLGIEANILEVILKNWQIVHHEKSFEPGDRLTFGSLVARCIDLGFPSKLGKRLQRFNKLRNDATHKLSIGKISYSDLENEYLQDLCLVEDVQQYFELSAPILGHYVWRF